MSPNDTTTITTSGMTIVDRAYHTLIRMGPSTAKQMAAEMKYDNIHSTLNGLIDTNRATVKKLNGIKIYEAIQVTKIAPRAYKPRAPRTPQNAIQRSNLHFDFNGGEGIAFSRTRGFMVAMFNRQPMEVVADDKSTTTLTWKLNSEEEEKLAMESVKLLRRAGLHIKPRIVKEVIVPAYTVPEKIAKSSVKEL